MPDYRTIVGYFPSQSTAESALNELKAAGFVQSQIGVAAAQSRSWDSTTPNTVAAQDGTIDNATPDSDSYRAGEKAGGAWASLKGFFTGNSAEPYAGESTGHTFNDREITPEDYNGEDIHSSLSGLSVPDEHARYFGHRLNSGTEGAVVTVNAAGREDEAIGIIKANGGDIGDDAANYDYSAAPASTEARDIKLYGEVLRVHKDRISSGEVRIRKEITTSTQTIEVPVTREELVVERVPVTGETVAAGSAFSGEEIRIPLSQERATIEKEAVVRDQVRIGKKEVTDTKSFNEEVRNEEIKVDPVETNVTR